MTGSRITGQCYSDHEWLPVDKWNTTDVMEKHSSLQHAVLRVT